MIYEETQAELSINITKLRGGYLVAHHTGSFVTQDLYEVIVFILSQYERQLTDNIEISEKGIISPKVN